MSELASQGKIDPAFLQITAKVRVCTNRVSGALGLAAMSGHGLGSSACLTRSVAVLFAAAVAQAYGAARDTNMTKDEAKWVAYKLYRQARDHFDRQQPKEKRILEYLLTIRDPTERRLVGWDAAVAFMCKVQHEGCSVEESADACKRTWKLCCCVVSCAEVSLCCSCACAATSWTRR